jgi:8-amino-7-oxononanoate synthase
MKRRPAELQHALADLDRQNLRRTRRTVEAFPESQSRVALRIDGRDVVDFSSNDYLGLSHHPAPAGALAHCATHAGAGSGAAHLITGHGIEHARLEEELAAFTGRERALLFSTGYMANLAVMSALAGRGEAVVLDRLCHASLIDGALLSGARLKRFAHADPSAAARALREHAAQVAIVATDGVFSMDGDVAPLEQLAALSREYDAWLVVDDAHGLGVLGPDGGGSLQHYGLDAEAVPLLMGTLGKALGSFGAFVAGASDLIEWLLQRARPYIYTTALPEPVAAASRSSLELARTEGWRRERVLALAARFRAAAIDAGLPLLTLNAAAPLTPIQPVLMPGAAAAVAAQHQLLESGFCVVAIRPPTVPPGSSRLRITLSAAHQEAQVDALVDALRRSCRSVAALAS